MTSASIFRLTVFIPTGLASAALGLLLGVLLLPVGLVSLFKQLWQGKG